MPAFSDVAVLLREKIHRGQYQPGEQLPNIRELAKMHGVSRSTVHTAFKILAADGLVELRHGKGAFVAPKRIAYSPLEDLEKQFESDCRTEVLACGWVKPHTATAQVLALGSDADVWTLCTADYLDGLPLSFNTYEMTRELAEPLSGDMRKQRALYSTICEMQEVPRLERTLLSVDTLTDAFLANVLGLPDRVTFYEILILLSAGDTALLTCYQAVPADRYRLRFAPAAGPSHADAWHDAMSLESAMQGRYRKVML